LVDEEVEDKALLSLASSCSSCGSQRDQFFKQRVATQLSYSAGTLHDPMAMAMALVSMEDEDEDG
jgi:hypothetical protein